MNANVLPRARAFASATLHEAAGQTGALPPAIKPVAKGFRVCGPAFTVRCSPANNVWLHRAIAAASAGDVLVADVGGLYEAGYWGEIMTVGARARGLGGLVIDGCVRDVEPITESGFPVFARCLSIRGTAKDLKAPGGMGEGIRIGDVPIHTGDLVLGDRDGVVVIPASRIEEVLELAAQRQARESRVMERLRAGETTLDVYGWK